MSDGSRGRALIEDSILASVAQQVPLVVGEMGEYDCAHGYIDSLIPRLDRHDGAPNPRPGLEGHGGGHQPHNVASTSRPVRCSRVDSGSGWRPASRAWREPNHEHMGLTVFRNIVDEATRGASPSGVVGHVIRKGDWSVRIASARIA